MNGKTTEGAEPLFVSYYKKMSKANSSSKPVRFSFSVRHSKGAAFYAGLGSDAAEKVNNIFYINPNGVVNFFGKDVHEKIINQDKFCMVDIILDRPSGTAKLYIDGDIIKTIETTDYPTAIEGILFEKKANYDVCLDDISLSAGNTYDPKTQIISNSPYYAQTLDRHNGVLYTYGQTRQRFLDKVYCDGMSDPVFVNEYGDTFNGTTVSEGNFLRLKDGLGRYIYFNTKKGTNSTITALGDINQDSAVNPDTENYYIYEQPDSDKIKGSILDTSSMLLDGPAGKYGYVQAKGDGFVCVDEKTGKETPIQFWGTNIGGSQAFSSHENAEMMADAVAAAGFNLVRIHNIDWGFLPNMFGDTRVDSGKKLDDVQMDKLCYFLNELKERGIYWFIDQTVSRPIFKDDGAPEGVSGTRGVAYFSEPVIKALENHSELYMGYYNKYTGMTIGEDPAMALIDLNNENSLEYFNVRTELYGTAYYDDYKKQYNEWLVEKYGTREALVRNWGDGASNSYFKWGLRDFEDPTKGTVEVSDTPLGQIKEEGKDTVVLSLNRLLDEKRFMTHLYETYFTRRIAHLRSIGVKCAITGATSWGGLNTESWYPNYSSTEFVDTHHYWSHPTGGKNLITSPGTRFNTNGGFKDAATGEGVKGVTSNLKADGLGFFGSLATGNVYSKPYTISEMKICPGNKYLAEGPLLAAAYGRLQDWNPLDFGFNAVNEMYTKVKDGEEIILTSTFSTAENPILRAMFPSASVMFLRKDVDEATSGYYTNYDGDVMEKDLPANKYGATTDEKHIWHYGPNSSYQGEWPKNITWADGHPFEKMGNYALVGKTGVSFNTDLTNVNDESIKQTADAATNGDKVYTSQTGQLTTDLINGTFKMNTDKSQAVCGFIGGKTYVAGNLNVNLSNEYAAVTLVSLDDKNIAQSSKMLLTMAGNAMNNGQILTDDGSEIKVSGKYPIMVEQIMGTVELKGIDGSAYTVYPLTSSGERKNPLTVTKTADGIKFTVAGDTKAMHFEIVKK